MKTPMANPGEIKPRWYVIDAEKEILGRAATRIANILMGKHRPTYTPHLDTGDFVIVLNAGKIGTTGNKDAGKTYQWYTLYPGGQRERSLAEMRVRKPAEIVRLAVRRMLPKSSLGRNMLKKLKIYTGTEHPHGAQRPEPLSFGTRRAR